MRIDAEDYMASLIEVLDLDTGEFIKRCLWANDETGNYCHYPLDVCDDYFYTDEIKKANIVFVYKGE